MKIGLIIVLLQYSEILSVQICLILGKLNHPKFLHPTHKHRRILKPIFQPLWSDQRQEKVGKVLFDILLLRQFAAKIKSWKASEMVRT